MNDIDPKAMATLESEERLGQQEFQPLDDATYEPRACLEQKEDFRQAEVIQTVLVDVMENPEGSETAVQQAVLRGKAGPADRQGQPELANQRAQTEKPIPYQGFPEKGFEEGAMSDWKNDIPRTGAEPGYGVEGAPGGKAGHDPAGMLKNQDDILGNPGADLDGFSLLGGDPLGGRHGPESIPGWDGMFKPSGTAPGNIIRAGGGEGGKKAPNKPASSSQPAASTQPAAGKDNLVFKPDVVRHSWDEQNDNEGGLIVDLESGESTTLKGFFDRLNIHITLIALEHMTPEQRDKVDISDIVWSAKSGNGGEKMDGGVGGRDVNDIFKNVPHTDTPNPKYSADLISNVTEDQSGGGKNESHMSEESAKAIERSFEKMGKVNPIVGEKKAGAINEVKQSPNPGQGKASDKGS
jgi:hypothetical protein